MTTNQFSPNTETNWQPIPKPAEITETRLIEAILNGTFPINSHLPGERELSDSLGVTRPTLREALQRLAKDGWLEIHHGKPTRVRDFWKEGNLGVLSALSEYPHQLPGDFIPNLLNYRLATAPVYTSLAVTNAPEAVVKALDGRLNLDDSPENFSQFDWNLQHKITLLCENPVFLMILNSFKDLFLNLAPYYFSIPAARQHSMEYYENLAQAAAQKNAERARILTETIMRESLRFWQETNFF